MRQDRHFNFQKRIYSLAFIMLAVFVVIILRLAYLQLYEAQTYKTLADDNRIHMRLVTAPRGRILDRNGVVLAQNKPVYQAILILSQIAKKDLPSLFEKIAPYLRWSVEEKEFLLTQVQKQPRHIPFNLKKELTWEEVTALEVRLWELPGVEIIETFQRDYPQKEAASHITGYVSLPSSAEIENDSVLALPDALVGKDGAEKMYDDQLRGDRGKKEIEVNAKGQAVRILSSSPPVPGPDLRLTIDAKLEAYMYEVLKDHQSAAAVVLDIETGDVLGLVSYPGYDPNALRKGISRKAWREFTHNPHGPLTNKITKGLYGPASLMKIIDDLVIYDHPALGPHFSVLCTGVMEVGRHKFHCWRKGGHGTLSLANALLKSCDVYYYEAARKMGPQPLIDMAHKLGFGQETGIDLPGEKKGFVPTPDWKKEKRKEKWYGGDTILLSIGQGSFLTTPLQWAVMLAQIANGGKAITPHVAEQPSDEGESLGISEKGLNHVLTNLGKAVNFEGGTAYKARILEKDFEMGGKTGTSQVRRITAEERKKGVRTQESLEWRLRDHAFFVGFAPVHQPRFVVAVLVEHGGWGSSAAPLGRDILKKTQELFVEKSA